MAGVTKDVFRTLHSIIRLAAHSIIRLAALPFRCLLRAAPPVFAFSRQFAARQGKSQGATRHTKCQKSPAMPGSLVRHARLHASNVP
jgi:hypothetical protein